MAERCTIEKDEGVYYIKHCGGRADRTVVSIEVEEIEDLAGDYVNGREVQALFDDFSCLHGELMRELPDDITDSENEATDEDEDEVQEEEYEDAKESLDIITLPVLHEQTYFFRERWLAADAENKKL